jgi:transposase
MGFEQKHPLRTVTPQEEQELRRVTKATSECLDVVKRARALLAVRAGQSFTDAAREAGYKSGDSVSQLVERFNQHGLVALCIAPGRGRKVTYTSHQRARIVAEVQRQPDRKADQTATWSLVLLRDALRKTDLPDIARETIRQVLHASGYSYQQTRTWCRTGYALRKRKSGTVTTYDEQTPEKKDGLSWRTSRRRKPDSCS